MTEKRTVLITGANGGIGRATVLEFSRLGWEVIGVDRDTLSFDFPDDGIFVQTDISQPDNVAELSRITRRVKEKPKTPAKSAVKKL